MSVFHHDNIYLTWLNLKADNLSTLNYPYHGENIGINNLIQLSGVASNRALLSPDRDARGQPPPQGLSPLLLLGGTLADS